MIPVVKVRVRSTYTIEIPMADIDGDQLRCRWGANQSESGGIYESKGQLQPNPCILTYEATAVGYEGVAVIIEDFDTNGQVLSSVPLQFLIEILLPETTTTTTTTTTTPITPMTTIPEGSGNTNDSMSSTNSGISVITVTIPSTDIAITTTTITTTTTIALQPCPLPPIYDGDWGSGACIGVPSNHRIDLPIAAKVLCNHSSTSIQNILTISPRGMVRSPITQDPASENRYVMSLQWTPDPLQYGIHPLCVTPVDSNRQSGRTVCFSLLVDVHSPQFVSGSMSPTGTVSQHQSIWTIAVDVDIVPPTNANVAAVFFKRDSSGTADDVEVARVSMLTAEYESRLITFNTDNITWEQVSQQSILIIQ